MAARSNRRIAVTGIVALHIIAVLIFIFGIVDTWMHPAEKEIK